MFTLAHISDPHLAGWTVPNAAALMGKRVTGYLSWRLKRANIHRVEVLETIVADMLGAKPDHIAVTGDLTNISLPLEFANAAEWLRRLGPPDRVSAIPGNHDTYVPLPWSQSVGLWQDNMTGLMPGESPALGAAERPVDGYDDFPYVRQRGPVALVGASTALPTLPFIAAGELGTAQLDRLGTVLEKLGDAGLFRILLIHHPPYPDPHGRRKSLRDHAALRAVLREKGVELVLHGHTHIESLMKVATPKGEAPVFGVPSASALAWKHKDPAAYHLYRIERGADAWRLRVEVKSLPEGSASVISTGEMELTIP